MQDKIMYMVLFLGSVFISSISQVMLKKSALKIYENKWKEYFNVPVILAYFLFFFSSLLTVFAYKDVPLSMGPILEATGYIWVSVLGVAFLKEKMSKEKIMGMIVLILGIIIFNLG